MHAPTGVSTSLPPRCTSETAPLLPTVIFSSATPFCVDRTFKHHFSSLNRIREKSDSSQSVNYAASRLSSVPLYPRENKPDFEGVFPAGIDLSPPPFRGQSVTIQGWVGQRSRPRRGRPCPKARPEAVGARRRGAGLRSLFQGGPESCVSLLAS